MEEERSPVGKENEAPEQPEKTKSAFRQKKEEWYDRIDLSVKQLDIFIAVCFGCLILVFILIALEAAGIFTLFPRH